MPRSFRRGLVKTVKLASRARGEWRRQDCAGCFKEAVIWAIGQLLVNEGETGPEKGKSKEGQKDGSAFGWPGHSSILGAFEETRWKPAAELPSRLYLNRGTGRSFPATRSPNEAKTTCAENSHGGLDVK